MIYLNDMKTKFLLVILISSLLFSCGKKTSLSFQNPQGVDRPDEVIILSKEEFQQRVSIDEGKFPLFKRTDNSLVPFQLDDLDGDGTWDEIAMLLDFPPHETIQVNVEWVDGNNYPPEFEKRTNLRLGITQEIGRAHV